MHIVPFLHGKTKQANDIVLKDNGAVIFGRQQPVKIGDTVSAWSDVKRGVPRGSVLGPNFLIYLLTICSIILDGSN